MSARVVKPPAKLESHNPNERLVVDDERGFSYDLLKKLSCFEGVDIDSTQVRLREFPGTIIVRYYRRGEEICIQDDPGYTAFYLLKRSEIEELIQAKKLVPIPLEGWDAKQVASVRRRYYARPARESEPVYLGEGDIFGEMSCLYRIPRTATVRAAHDCYVLEFMRNVFKRSKFENKISSKVIERLLELHLRGFELFDKLSQPAYDEVIQKIKHKLGLPPAGETEDGDAKKKPKKAAHGHGAELLQVRSHNEILFDEYDRPDGMYIIRLGLVKVIKNASALLGLENIKDWPAFFLSLAEGAEPGEGPRQALWRKLHEKVPAIMNRIAAGEVANLMPPEQQELLYTINDLLKLKTFHQLVPFKFEEKDRRHQAMAEEAKTLKDSKDYDEVLKLRSFNRRLLELIVGSSIQTYGVTPPRTLAYRSSREWVFPTDDEIARRADSALIGEIGLFENAPRSATCVTYCHPESKLGNVQLVYVDKELFQELLKDTHQNIGATSSQHLKQVAAQRKQVTTARMNLPVWQESSFNQRFDDLGLMQGQKLMLIDLDRCTRCDKCVEACVESHTKHWWTGLLPFTSNTGPLDGRSRLFLDGPRVQMMDGASVKNYLVPSTCRQCKDAVCLFNCPVCSIHKGDNGQIVIEDWCIGCTQCANYCPYNAIQMHSIGIIPFSTFGWSYRPRTGQVIEDHTPFRYDPAFADLLRADDRMDFSYGFTLSPAQIKTSRIFLLQIESMIVMKTPGAAIMARINDQPVTLKEQAKKNWEATLVVQKDKNPLTLPDEEPPQKVLCAGQQMLTITVSLPKGSATPKIGDLLLDAGLIGYVPPKVDQTVVEKSDTGEEYKQEWVMQLAAVCDMCSGQLGQQPACVNACPHEAAERRYVH